MSGPTFGAGGAGAGVSSGGFGSPATTGTLTGATPLRDARGIVSGSALISTAPGSEGQYVWDANSGERVGMPDARQLVLIAAKTARARSAVPSVGETFGQTRKIDAAFKRNQERRAAETFEHLVRAGVVTIERVAVDTAGGSAPTTTVYLRDTSTGLPLDQVL